MRFLLLAHQILHKSLRRSSDMVVGTMSCHPVRLQDFDIKISV